MTAEVELKVANAYNEDVGRGYARLDEETRNILGVDIGDIVEITGKDRGKSTAAIVWRLRGEDSGKHIIRIESLLRKNAGVSMGDRVIVRKAVVQPASRVVLAPLGDWWSQDTISGMDSFIKHHLEKRPVLKGNAIIVPGFLFSKGHAIFRVVNTTPAGIVQITSETALSITQQPLRSSEEMDLGVTYEDIGGLREEIRKVRETIELPLKHPELFDRLGIDPPKGVLLYGPPGTGKTLIAKALANEAGASFFSIQGPEIMNKFYGESEGRLREIFEQAEKSAPSVIFIDEIDSIAPKRDEVSGEVERRVVAQLLTLMDGLNPRKNVVVIAATNRVNSLDPALRRPGRFDREIEIGVPDKEGRKEILQVHTRGMPVGDDVDIDELAAVTHGFVGADLASLAREAAMRALSRYLPDLDLDRPVPSELLAEMKVIREDFMEALKMVEPSSLREVLIEVPNVSWDEVGDLEEAKKELKEAVELPMKHPEVFQRMGIRPVKGILLYGPPGAGKTLLAKAVATESEANFISIKGPEVLSKWVGESEKAIREIFRRAKQASPSIIFLDEIDSIAPPRGSYTGESGVSERLVNQLLTSIDGVEDMGDVVVMAATNRPDMVDPALLRAGRFDKLVYIPPPDEEGRKKIFQVHTKNMPLADDVDLDELARKTEGYVGADIESVCREAAMVAVRKDMEAERITMQDFLEAIERISPSVSEDTLKYYENIKQFLERTSGPKREREEALNNIYG
ncbi:MAG: CDC48 family AAA ATPase [Thermoplasmata archaeon]|nr:CDC48 family AAA ATPase [Thermoplasmata archaeon]